MLAGLTAQAQKPTGQDATLEVGTALDLILRANARDTLIILGYATSGVVLSTVRFATDLDYRLVVVEDCCADQDPDVHDFLTQRIFPRQAEVVTSEDVIQAVRA